MDLQHHAECAVDELNTLQDVIRWSVSRMSEAGIYYGHGTDNPWDEALLLVTHALHLPWNLANEWRNAQLTRTERQAAIELILTRIEQRVPAPYLTGVAWFCNLPFVVDERVLIPRSPIGQMIDQGFAPWWQGHTLDGQPQPQRIMDLCTGSGCIGIAMAKKFPQAEVELLDLSFEALEVADENIQRHQLEDRVMALQSDLFAAASGKYDLIVSNPPYVDADDMSCLPEEYHHEPEMALAAGDDGLDLVRIMLKEARQYLTDDGLLVVEVGNSWPALAAAYPQLPFVWPEFEHGGHGVFVLQARDLDLLN
ncbi:50S ribosomal protein L3 N(5)-glutamine methyltransferase [Thalassolituus hydrocarboniclasticus]|uniref:Ribosomal protein uL3 glutamine methyltransferase n=1 Tax=Thalassolituus hydrocarboniclasticus TaxID=2742796 RepID=A0ABY6ADF1_9GAMM|nr:50S ribosomal protein L3 N(5)-glutamine methyltransferase [Thalassolituus hydrocarboniclasticus]UXD87999.1 50S ribosomal protein L3 N(5)-glutamine methyltransferase [Thalassolituus hydrocarboniclasticus]